MTALIATDYTTASLWADLGGSYQQKSFDRKIQALTDPAAYANDRKAELGKIQAAAEGAFKTSFAGFQDAGLSPDASKAAAFQSARAEYANQMRVFNLKFGQGTDQVYQTVAGHSTSAGEMRTIMSGNAPAVRRRAAPAKRRPRRKKS
jgi:hypothetical protein